MIKVLIVDDHNLVRIGMRSMLQGVEGIQVVGTVSSGEEALSIVTRLHPHVVLLDVQMSGIGGGRQQASCWALLLTVRC